MTALERAARAVLNACPIGYGMTKDESEIYARAVLMAVKEPDMGVWIDADCDEDTHPISCFTAMIDAILNEKDTTND